MAARNFSRISARAAMDSALLSMNRNGHRTRCQDRPVPFTEVRQTPEEAAELCGVGTVQECPLIALCEGLARAEGRNADDMVYGGKTWRKGVPLDSEAAYREREVRRRIRETERRAAAASL